ncbi:MAG: sigma factor [Anaerocolumna aminovalerica]|uniref:sigma factor n=1 Tax=Anaerocolumna aminovalerica TaxID=1527 RepID=UPI001C0F26E6|nr:sigma factor [Anaerocolumna aminovalerica]MBU5332276.1 hypothetical protein [Anaerocolumna aminovalerica]MDU6265392.1 sigma factor [Anaerocolumna aminovalerica]
MEFKEIYNLHEKQVYRYLLTLCRDEHLAEELTQETFYRAYLQLRTFKENVIIRISNISKDLQEKSG